MKRAAVAPCEIQITFEKEKAPPDPPRSKPTAANDPVRSVFARFHSVQARAFRRRCQLPVPDHSLHSALPIPFRLRRLQDATEKTQNFDQRSLSPQRLVWSGLYPQNRLHTKTPSIIRQRKYLTFTANNMQCMFCSIPDFSVTPFLPTSAYFFTQSSSIFFLETSEKRPFWEHAHSFLLYSAHFGSQPNDAMRLFQTSRWVFVLTKG